MIDSYVGDLRQGPKHQIPEVLRNEVNICFNAFTFFYLFRYFDCHYTFYSNLQ